MALRTLPKRYEFIADSDYSLGGTAGANIIRRLAWNQNHLWSTRGGILQAWGEPSLPSFLYPLYNANELRDPITGPSQVKYLANFIFPNDGHGTLRCLVLMSGSGSNRSTRVGIGFLLPGESAPTTLTPVTWTSYSTNTSGHYLIIETKVLASHKGMVRCVLIQQSDANHTDTGSSGACGAQVVWKAWAATDVITRPGAGRSTYLGDRMAPTLLTTSPAFDAGCSITPAHLRVIDQQMNALWCQPRLVYNGNFGQARSDLYNGYLKWMAWFPLQAWPLGTAGPASWTLKVRWRVRLVSSANAAAGTCTVYVAGTGVYTSGATNALQYNATFNGYESYTDFSTDISGLTPNNDTNMAFLWSRTVAGANAALDTTVGASIQSVVAWWEPSWSGSDTYQPIDESALVGGSEIYTMDDRYGRRAGAWYLMNNSRYLLQKRSIIPVVAWYGARYSKSNFAKTGCDQVNGNYAGPGGFAAQNPNGVATASGFGFGGTSGGPLYAGYNLAEFYARVVTGTPVRMIGQTSRQGITGAPNGDDSPDFATLRLFQRSATTIKSYLVMDSGAQLGGWATSGYEQALTDGQYYQAQACVGATASTAADVCLGLQGLYCYELPLGQSDIDAL